MSQPRTTHTATTGARRKHRARPLPKWVKHATELDAVARSRCLLVLSVLSGETPVSDAIAQAKISRGTYYHLETRALNAMLAALNPLSASASDGSADLSAATRRIGQLEATVKRLQQDHRRAQRLLWLTRKSLRVPLVGPRRGRRPKTTSSSEAASGASPPARSKRRMSATSAPTPPGASSR
jgi:hypothetical protein